MSLAEKELQQTRKDNQALSRYIHARRKKEEVRKEEEAWKKVMVVARMSDEGQSSKDVRTWRKWSSKGGSSHLPFPSSYYVSFVEWLVVNIC
jgi:hypothetical protein